MDIKKIWIPALKSIIPLFLIFLEIDDFINLIKAPGAYPFEREAYYSIYRSEFVYLSYGILFTIILLLLIYYAFKRNRKLYIITLCLAIIFFLYPIFVANG